MGKEDQLIERIRRRVPHVVKGLRVGIGDDAAVILARKGTEWVVTADAFLEDVHFLRRLHSPGDVGYKALARATSDIAAMGAKPRYFLLSLALPPACASRWLDEFLDGMAVAARRFGLTLAGGDTTNLPSIMINLTVMGEAVPGQTVLRSGAKPGEIIFVSGRLGEAELGLRILQAGLSKRRALKKLLGKHFRPEPRLALGQWLAGHRAASAMIDTSDGLSTDLGHICKSSGVGARMYAEKIPAVNVPAALRELGLDPLQLALDGGEDYELLFTVPKRLAGRWPKIVAGVLVTAIGEITRERKIGLVDLKGRVKPIEPGGWDPFRAKTASS